MRVFILIVFLAFCRHSFSQLPTSRTYLELNGGMAQLSDEFAGGWFPGASFLIGQQNYITNYFFLEIQGGVAFPSFITVKTGLGFTTQGIGLSVGMRIFPTTCYVQIHFPSKNGQFNISAEASPLLNTELSFLSYGAKNVFTVGYQWNVGKNRKK